VATKADLEEWVVEALTNVGGSGSVVTVSKKLWELHAHELDVSGDLFFTWQYDVRWAAQKLRDRGVLVSLKGDRRGVWTLA